MYTSMLRCIINVLLVCDLIRDGRLLFIRCAESHIITGYGAQVTGIKVERKTTEAADRSRIVLWIRMVKNRGKIRRLKMDVILVRETIEKLIEIHQSLAFKSNGCMLCERDSTDKK